MTTDTFTKAQLALLCWRNAPAGKAFNTMKALAFIVRNRVRAGWMGGSWLGVIEHDPFYSAYQMNGHHFAVADGNASQLESYPDLRNDVFQRFLWEVDRIYDGSSGDTMTEGGLWWAETDKVSRPWFLDNICRRPEEHPRVAQVAAITLWR